MPLHLGGFLPSTGVADLRGFPSIPQENPALWVPEPLVAQDGWGLVGRGWYPEGARSVVRFWRRSAGGSYLLLDLNQSSEAPPGGYRIAVSLNGKELGSFETVAERQLHHFTLPTGLLTEVNDVELTFEPSVAPVGGATPLSLMRIGVESGRSFLAPPRDSSEFRLLKSGGAVFTRSGVFVIPVDVPVDADRVELRIRNQNAGLTTHRLFVQRSLDEQIELLSGHLGDRQWRQQTASIEDLRGERVVFGWELNLVGEGGRVELGDLRIRAGSETAESKASIPSMLEVKPQRPDVILIILDAARGDRFPGWSYPRQTMPVIEELGLQSLNFRYAFSECPTTSCSVPAMITGVPFLSGGQVGGGQQLAEGVQTLAEYLSELGYHTVGLSATPNNSTSHNLDQGFEVFQELWGEGNPNHGPFNMSRIANGVIHDQPATEPLFLQLHYLPPHQPYDPGPQFDRFTDPGYTGVIRPDMSLKSYNLGLEDLAGEDLDHLVGLYDGNLSVADAAVGQVLQALKSTGRFDNAIFIITSDHGEAFMEHGRQGHNTTLFDEMLHVPLMVRLPGGERPPSVELDRLASSLDIVPTVLGMVGTSARPEVGGLDLLRTSPDPLRPRTLFFRSSHPQNTMLAARTLRWKAISWPRHQVQMLFDLAEDPGELTNLVGEQPYLYSGLGLLTRHHLVQRTGSRLQGDEVEMTEEAKETLRALGYLN